MLWTDLIDPATLTGYARASMQDHEEKRNYLAHYLPNRSVPSLSVRFDRGVSGMLEAAEFRAYDAELEVGERRATERVTMDLPTLGQRLPVSEYDQLTLRNASNGEFLNEVKGTARAVARAVADRMEYQRGQLLATGRATIDQARYKLDEDFGRKAEFNVTATKLWSDPSADVVEELRTWVEAYRDENDEDPGEILLSTKAYRALRKMSVFQNTVTGRPVTDRDIEAILLDHDIPALRKYDRKVKLRGKGVVRVIPEDTIILLPASVGTDDYEGTDLGASYWGQTLTSSELSWGIEPEYRPGIVTGVYRNEKPPVIAEVISDAIGMPVLANANLSMAAKVL